MEHPPKQGLKLPKNLWQILLQKGFNGTSTKTRIETAFAYLIQKEGEAVLMEHPPKQGLKHTKMISFRVAKECFNGTSTKTRIETSL